MRLLSFPALAFYFAAITLTAISAASPESAVKVEGADSPTGKYTLAARMESGSTCRVEVRAAGSDEPLAHFSIPHYDADNQHYRISALWMEDATAFALNVDSGRSITYCRIFISNPDGWTELSLPRKPIEKVRKAGNAKDPSGPTRDYLDVTEWLPKDNVKRAEPLPGCVRAQNNQTFEPTCICAPLGPGSANFPGLVHSRSESF